MNLQNRIDIHKYISGKIEEISDEVITEYPLTIYLNDEELVTLLCSPDHLKELAVGFLLSEGFIDEVDEATSIDVFEDKGEIHVSTLIKRPLREKLMGKRTVTSGCGKGTSFYNVLDAVRSYRYKDSIEIMPKSVLQLMREFNQSSTLFKETGGTHGCALASDDEILIHIEDIGRHNAMDKVIGKARLMGLDLGDKMVLTTGRVSSEILIKACKQGIPVIASRSAPTSLAVELARETGITLIGFARGDKLNIYNNFPSIRI
ncbi:MAG: formate dehydrogenase accessory sulfurtransferase FdhD [Gudongella sp.]|jgi:FdhD protein|nr:formate dehydrogenase accessory sulfurtransferase FdhD [Gudongella sp.]